jgi:hypothetical protein
MTDDAVLARAMALRREGNLAEATQVSLSLIDTSERNQALELAAVCLIESRRYGELMTAIQLAGTRGYLPPLLFSRVLDHCLRTDRLEIIDELAPMIPEDSPLHPLGVYFAGCTRVVRRDPAAALAIFTHFRSIVSRYMQAVPFATDKDLNTHYRQAILLAAPDEIDTRLAAEMPPAVADFRLIQTASPARHLIASVANGAYIERFARDLMASVAPEDALHLHAVDPTPETLALLEDLGQRAGTGRFGCSISRDPSHGSSTAYACARYFVGPALLEIYRRKIIVVDIDVRLRERVGTLDLTAPDFDFACFRTTRREPSSLYSAIMMVFTPGPAGVAFLEALGLYCRFGLKLRYPSLTWLLDQAALYSLKHYFAVRRPDFRFQILNDLTGGEALDFVELVTTDEEKHEMKWRLELQRRQARQ